MGTKVPWFYCQKVFSHEPCTWQRCEFSPSPIIQHPQRACKLSFPQTDGSKHLSYNSIFHPRSDMAGLLAWCYVGNRCSCLQRKKNGLFNVMHRGPRAELYIIYKLEMWIHDTQGYKFINLYTIRIWIKIYAFSFVIYVLSDELINSYCCC